ncbi:FAD-dependent oxidoreductase [Lutibacter profundi]|uniref:FAD-dependent oxidoreductase n=1 Tax=Lutibacter profundi TaxID=1622118 RepID=A0A0X8G847_9FLAO|nr:FAD-dependent oxidoreductase [Lutibacter profundi]AMC11833.1 FAD-dependent oxidoreductase [Lutibacter profundi]
MQVDYIIVGFGLAGLAFTEELEKHKKSFVVYEDNSQNSSIVAGGMYNPVILKRFTPVWDAVGQLKIAMPFYQSLEKKFNKKYNYSTNIYRIFKSIEEQNNWFIACDKPLLTNFMVPKIIDAKIEGVVANYGYGKLINTGRIDTSSLLQDYRQYLLKKKTIKYESFNYTELKIGKKIIEYKNVKALKVVFCEGFGMVKNPFFNYLPMQEAKGELITIYAPELHIDFLIKAAVFVLPLGDNYYKIGATFNWKDKTKEPTQNGKQELITKLNSFITVPYTIVDHTAGIRPTVKDRRPLAGKHPKYQNLAILNGLGTRGVMIAPTIANKLYNHLENKFELDKEISIARFG